MSKTILITGSTNGIGLATAKKMLALGHKVLIHGRNPEKLKKVHAELSQLGQVDAYCADLSKLEEVRELASNVRLDHSNIDVLINNAGIFKTPQPVTNKGLDIRFVVNTVAPYVLTQELLSVIPASGRIVNLSSAAQAPVESEAMLGKTKLEDFDAYAQSKLAITMWSFDLAEKLSSAGPTVLAVNPGSLLGSKMVKEGFGTAGKDIAIGVDILTRLSLNDEFEGVTGKYFDNDSGQFSAPHPEGLDSSKVSKVVSTIEKMLSEGLV